MAYPTAFNTRIRWPTFDIPPFSWQRNGKTSPSDWLTPRARVVSAYNLTYARFKSGIESADRGPNAELAAERQAWGWLLQANSQAFKAGSNFSWRIAGFSTQLFSLCMICRWISELTAAMRTRAPNMEKRPEVKARTVDFWVQVSVWKASINCGISEADMFKAFQAIGVGAE